MGNALLIVDHGSRRKEANDMLETVADLIRRRAPGLIVHSAHMELAEPSIEQGIAACAADGATSLVVHPYMLSPGRHAVEDIPRMVREIASRYQQLEISVSAPLGVHEKLAEVVLERAGLEQLSK